MITKNFGDKKLVVNSMFVNEKWFLNLPLDLDHCCLIRYYNHQKLDMKMIDDEVSLGNYHRSQQQNIDFVDSDPSYIQLDLLQNCN